jgi:hypothetical protein
MKFNKLEIVLCPMFTPKGFPNVFNQSNLRQTAREIDRDRVGQIYIKKQQSALDKGSERILDINYVKLTNIDEMYNLNCQAGDETRTHDVHHGKVTFYH